MISLHEIKVTRMGSTLMTPGFAVRLAADWAVELPAFKLELNLFKKSERTRRQLLDRGLVFNLNGFLIHVFEYINLPDYYENLTK